MVARRQRVGDGLPGDLEDGDDAARIDAVGGKCSIERIERASVKNSPIVSAAALMSCGVWIVIRTHFLRSLLSQPSERRGGAILRMEASAEPGSSACFFPMDAFGGILRWIPDRP
jgi:hypothetical protein